MEGGETAEARGLLCCKRWAGSYEPCLSPPDGVDVDRIKARFKNGVLEVHLPKVEEGKGRKVEIKVE